MSSSRPFSFAFPPPFQVPQNIFYKDRDGPQGPQESKIHLVNRPPHPDQENKIRTLIDQGHYLLGICAFENWPARIHNPADPPVYRDYDLFTMAYYRRFVGFLHNFREPRDVFPDDLPLLTMDFSDYVQVKKRRKGQEKEFDLLYYAGHKIDGQPTTVAWSSVIKQHALARELIQKLLDTDPGVRICLIHDSFGIDDPRITRFDFLGYREFLDKVEASRILLMPSVLDASPRVITEALCLDTYVMVNAEISGGWKYVNAETGAFFDRTNSLEVYQRLRARGPARARAWFLRNYPNNVLEDRFNAWLNGLILAYCAWNRFGRVFYLTPDGEGEMQTSIQLELFRHQGIYGDCVERVPVAAAAGNPHKARARAHLAALSRARELGLPDAVIFDDDFQFIVPRQVANRKIGALLADFPAWDVILFGNHQITAHEATPDASVMRVMATSAPHGYAVRARHYDALIAGLSAACDAMPDAADEGAGEVDAVWARVATSANVHAFRAPLGEGQTRMGRWSPPPGHLGASCGD